MQAADEATARAEGPFDRLPDPPPEAAPPFMVRSERGVVLLACHWSLSREWQFPPVAANPLRDEQPDLRPLSEVGTLYAYTVVHRPGREAAPAYGLALVDFPEGVRIFGRLLPDCMDRLHPGMPVRVVETRAEDGAPDYAFSEAKDVRDV